MAGVGGDGGGRVARTVGDGGDGVGGDRICLVAGGRMALAKAVQQIDRYYVPAVVINN